MSKYDPNYISDPTYYLVGVKTIIAGPDGKILLLKRSDKESRPHGWDFTGGGVDSGEDPIESAIRESKEEAGLDVYDLYPISTYTRTTKENGKTDYEITIGCKAKTNSYNVKLTWEHEDYKWMMPQKATKLELPKGHRKLLEAFISSK